MSMSIPFLLSLDNVPQYVAAEFLVYDLHNLVLVWVQTVSEYRRRFSWIPEPNVNLVNSVLIRVHHTPYTV